ncbi:MAG TPA: DUF885 family protein [Sphingomonas sp.]|uniref:DUF885 domain-containing protein n=1 Tax=Sphingomonas sp. TaxID=28214 RepID=UPI002BDC2481|nr:DUF885 family protein [Sphingomonas sp.]HMI20488.1 DUF885 family protein [Sphingomonas sp.]
MLTNRRELLAGAGAIGVAAAMPALAQGTPGDTQAILLLDTITSQLLDDFPETAAGLGIDKGPRVGLRSRFGDRSHEADFKRAARCAQNLAKLRAIDRTGLSHSVALDLDVCQSAHELADEGWKTMPVGDNAIFNTNNSYRSTPYVVAQNTGAFVELPDTLENHHDVANEDDAEAYLSRLDSYALALNGETGRLIVDQAKGAILPGFLIDIAVKELTGMRDQPIDQWTILESFRVKCEHAGLPAKRVEQAKSVCQGLIAPALGRQIDAFALARPKASDVPGVWQRPDGDAYYSWLVKAGTTTEATPDELHKLGVEQNKALNAEIDTLLKAQGITKGSVGERLTALSRRPDLLFSDDDAGRAKLLAYLNGRIADVRTRLPRAFATMVKGNLVIKRVPPAIQDGMPDGYAGPGSIDGTTPGIYYINLKDTSNWPRYALPTLCYHEGIPGHVWQGEYSYKLPLIRSLLAFNAYSEGWALYSEQLGDELGCYADDPLGKIGYLQSINFRACRLVVDTGIHAKRWSFDQALDWFSQGTGQPREQLRAELNRYCSWPGQACGYKMGHNEINRLRTKAKASLGARFDLRTFDDAIVLGGNMPLTMLARVVDHYVATART